MPDTGSLERLKLPYHTIRYSRVDVVWRVIWLWFFAHEQNVLGNKLDVHTCIIVFQNIPKVLPFFGQCICSALAHPDAMPISVSRYFQFIVTFE